MNEVLGPHLAQEVSYYRTKHPFLHNTDAQALALWSIWSILHAQPSHSMRFLRKGPGIEGIVFSAQIKYMKPVTLGRKNS